MEDVKQNTPQEAESEKEKFQREQARQRQFAAENWPPFPLDEEGCYPGSKDPNRIWCAWIALNWVIHVASGNEEAFALHYNNVWSVTMYEDQYMQALEDAAVRQLILTQTTIESHPNHEPSVCMSIPVYLSSDISAKTCHQLHLIRLQSHQTNRPIRHRITLNLPISSRCSPMRHRSAHR